MRITEAAKRLGLSPRMLRYRESLGLLPPSRSPGGHRQYGDAELRAVIRTLELERRFNASPAELAFALRVLSEPEVAHAVRDLGRRLGRIAAPHRRAGLLDFEKEKALRLLHAQEHGRDRPVG